ncbi:MAG: translation initiation factor IF-2 subunit gamma [Candidatus Micrarchaeota archaeon]
MAQAELNIGLLGHVDHGKTSLTKCLTGVWTDTHSEELKRGISIKLGYADAVFRKCSKCSGVEAYTSSEKCPKCGSATHVLRKVSFLDAPGHEMLMTTAIAMSSIIDGAVLVVAANEKCPQAQTLEHLMILDILGIKHVVIAQNKVDLVPREKVIENQKQIREMVKGTCAENAPIIPVVANYQLNIDALIFEIEKNIPTPKRDINSPPRMYIARSFDVNKPGTEINKLVGGVIGGSIIRGKLKIGDEIELIPGINKGEKGKEAYITVKGRIERLSTGKEQLTEAIPGGLIAIGTKLDPAVTKADGLVGNMLGIPGSLPKLTSDLDLEFTLLKRAGMGNTPLIINEPIVISAGTATTIGFVLKVKKKNVMLKLKRSVVVEKGSRVALSRRVGQRWRLAGFGVVA